MSNSKNIALFSVPALDCPEELRLIGKGLSASDGVIEFEPDYLQRTLRVRYDATAIDPESICRQICRTGFTAHVVTSETPAPVDNRSGPGVAVLIGGALLALATIWHFAIGDTDYIAASLAIAATIVAGFNVAKAAFRAVRLRSLDMNALMVLAAAGAIATGERFEAATAMLLFGVSLWLERFSMDRARNAVSSLVALTPSDAHRLESDGHVDDVKPGELKVGDRIVVRPGERVPIDGIVRVGISSVDESPLTGESVPVDKKPDSIVFAGTLNGEGALEVIVEKEAGQSTLAHIAQLVAQASSSRSPTERFVDRFARSYTPVVIAAAIVVASGSIFFHSTEWFHRALVLLVVACPCALVISTPVTIVCGLNRAARRGMLIKGGVHLEQAGRIRGVVFDKTGTLTRGEMSVRQVAPSRGNDSQRLLAIAAAIEQSSDHPIARAIVKEARSQGMGLVTPTEFTVVRGDGIKGIVAGESIVAGSERLLEREGIAIEPSSEIGAYGVAIYVAADGGYLGAILLDDALRADSIEAVGELRSAGVNPIAVLSGDRVETTARVASTVGIETALGGLLPKDKVNEVRRIAEKEPMLAMIGDGVNDAPALAAAQLGIAFGSGASDTALETADVVIVSSHVKRIGELFALGRRTRAILLQNIALSLGAKAIVFALAAAGYATLWMAVAADVGASLIVVANGMRLLAGRTED